MVEANMFFLQRVHTGSGVHPVFYALGARGYFPGIMKSKCTVGHELHLVSTSLMHATILSLPHMPSRYGG
jgi:hypothetical protein